jgi:Ubiquitin-protein ligase
MNTYHNSSTAIRRIQKDLKEIEREPVPGVSICMPDISDPFILHANLEIKDGIYEGILLHLIVHIPPDYPITPPAVNICPGLNFGHKHHQHIFDDLRNGNSICTDLISNFRGHFEAIDASGKPVKSGWTPSYTLSSVLIQLQVFFADPDFPLNSLPSKEDIQELRDHVKKFTTTITVNDGKTQTTVIHSYNNPYPPVHEIADKSCETEGRR